MITEDGRMERRHIKAVAKTFLQSHSILVTGRRKQNCRRESHWYKPSKCAEPDAVEEEAVKIIRSFKSEAGTPCLVGFSIGYELNVLFFTYPRLMKEFSTIIDLQLVVRDLCDMNICPSLRNTLDAFGLGCMNPRYPYRQLCAGNDAVKIALLLVNILRLPSSPRPSLPTIACLGPKGKRVLYEWGQNKAFRHRKFWTKSRPMPKELFPYTAVMFLKVANGHKRLEFPYSPESLFNLFEQYSPTASGISDRTKRNGHYEPKRGYLSFGSLESLNDFVEFANKKVLQGCLWAVFSKYDPSIRPASSLEEHQRNVREGQMAQKEAKREQRQEKQRNKQEFFDNAGEEDTGGFFGAMFAS